MTRGVHFGYDRNNFTFHFDDAFASDSLWDPDSELHSGRGLRRYRDRTRG